MRTESTESTDMTNSTTDIMSDSSGDMSMNSPDTRGMSITGTPLGVRAVITVDRDTMHALDKQQLDELCRAIRVDMVLDAPQERGLAESDGESHDGAETNGAHNCQSERATVTLRNVPVTYSIHESVSQNAYGPMILPHEPSAHESMPPREYAGHGNASATQQQSHTDTGNVLGNDARVTRTAILSMNSRSPNAEHMFRSTVVSLDAIPGNQIEGISPLYHVASFDGPDALSAVVQLTTRMPLDTLYATLQSIEVAHEGAITTQIVDFEGTDADETDHVQSRHQVACQAGVLAPWLDMDPSGKLGSKPISFLLAMAPDAAQVGMVSDNWIIGETQ